AAAGRPCKFNEVLRKASGQIGGARAVPGRPRHAREICRAWSLPPAPLCDQPVHHVDTGVITARRTSIHSISADIVEVALCRLRVRQDMAGFAAIMLVIKFPKLEKKQSYGSRRR